MCIGIYLQIVHYEGIALAYFIVYKELITMKAVALAYMYLTINRTTVYPLQGQSLNAFPKSLLALICTLWKVLFGE